MFLRRAGKRSGNLFVIHSGASRANRKEMGSRTSSPTPNTHSTSKKSACADFDEKWDLAYALF